MKKDNKNEDNELFQKDYKYEATSKIPDGKYKLISNEGLVFEGTILSGVFYNDGEKIIINSSRNDSSLDFSITSKNFYHRIKADIDVEIDKKSSYPSREENIHKYCEEADKYRSENKFVKELETLASALHISPNNADTLILVGRCFRTLGLYDDAVKAYMKSIKINPNIGVSYTNLALVYYFQNNWIEAIRYYKIGLSIMSNTSDDYWIGYVGYALVIGRMGNLKKAKKMIAEAELNGYPNGDAIRTMIGINE